MTPPNPADPAAAADAKLPPPTTPRAYTCRCGRPVFFRNSECLACHTPLGYDPEQGLLLPIEPVEASAPGAAPAATATTAAPPATPAAPIAAPAPADTPTAAAPPGAAAPPTAAAPAPVAASPAPLSPPTIAPSPSPLQPAPPASASPPAALGQSVQQPDPAAAAVPTAAAPPGLWHAWGAGPDAPRFHRCSNLGSAAACNWLVAHDDAHAGTPPLCRCCRLTRTVPDLSLDDSALWWNRIEVAKRRLVSQLIGLGLPVRSRTTEDPERGIVFDLLRAEPGGKPVITGHADGVITLDVAEADDAHREQRRTQLHEPYRTLLGHLRHECGHYYWQRLVEDSQWIEPYRQTFGDERQDYSEALKKHYDAGPPADWGQHYVSAYASSHPWEDWAETWAHYLHLVDTLDTALSFGLDGERVELSYERYGPEVVEGSGDPQPDDFLRLLNGWMELTGVLNELSRSMGVSDFYPFVLSTPAVRKLHLVHRIIESARKAGE